MRKALSLFFPAGSVWSKVAGLTTILFFTLLSDAILSDWIPVYMQTVLGSAFLMGLVMSFSSMVGLAADFVFPQILKGATVRKLMLLAILSSVVFSLMSLWSTYMPFVFVFLVAMAVWGFYYEFLGFASQQFVAESAGVHERTAVWGVMGVFRSLAYFLGPILGGILMVRGDKVVVIVAGAIAIFSYLMLLTLRVKSRPVSVEVGEINFAAEASHWRVLFVHVWPMLLASLVLGLVDATFWTTGTVLTEILSKASFLGGLFLPMYVLPSLFVGFIIARLGIYKGKKKWAEIFMLFSGAVLMLLFYQSSVIYQLAIVFLSSVMLSLSYPLIEAVYSDIVARMGRERKHLLGLSHSMVSIAYIIGPILSGLITNAVGERMTFVVMGAIMVIASLFLLVITPKKLKLPQKEMATWG